MKIEVKQVQNEGKNEFEISYDNTLKYKAKLPFISISEPLDLEKIRSIKIYDTNDQEIYTTDYNYLENLKEQFLPMKFLITGSQKFNQLLFISSKNTIKIYYEETAIWNNRYVIEINDKKYFCYSIEDGYIRHFPIYENETQIGEILKSNVVIDGKDEYYCYLKENDELLSDAIVSLLLYLDRSEYNSSYVVNKSYNLSKSYSYNKTNKFYDKNWVKNNFGDEFFIKVEKDVNIVKEKIKHPIQTSKELKDSISKKDKNALSLIIIIPIAIILIVLLILLIIALA